MSADDNTMLIVKGRTHISLIVAAGGGSRHNIDAGTRSRRKQQHSANASELHTRTHMHTHAHTHTCTHTRTNAHVQKHTRTTATPMSPSSLEPALPGVMGCDQAALSLSSIAQVCVHTLFLFLCFECLRPRRGAEEGRRMKEGRGCVVFHEK